MSGGSNALDKETEPSKGPEVNLTTSHGLLQGNLVYVKRRSGNKLDTEYKGTYQVASEDAATCWRVLELDGGRAVGYWSWRVIEMEGGGAGG